MSIKVDKVIQIQKKSYIKVNYKYSSSFENHLSNNLSPKQILSFNLEIISYRPNKVQNQSMTQNQNTDVNALLNPPLGKKPNLSQKQLKNMRMVLQFVNVTSPTKNTFYYNIIQKESNWGFSSNQRLLILNVEQKALSYLSKIPQGYLPYTSYEEIAANKVKQKFVITEVQNFKCNPVKGKISTFLMEWVDKDKSQKKWSLTVGSSKLMNDWIGLINSLKDGTFDKEKYEQISKMGNNNLFTNNNTGQPQINTNPNQQNQGLPTSNLGYVSPQPQVNNKESSKPIQSQYPSQSNLQNINNSQMSVQKLQNSSNTNLQNPTFYNSHMQKGPSQSNIPNNNLIPGQSVVKLNYNSFVGGESQFSRKPKIPKMGESTNKMNTYEMPNNSQVPNNFGSNLTEQPNRTSYNNQQPNFNTHSPDSNQQYLPTFSQNIKHGVKVQNSNTNLRPYDNNFGPSSNIISNSNVDFNSKTLQPSQSQPGDFVQELKRQRNKNPERFVLNNELSQKKFYQNNNSPQTELQYPGYYQSNEANNFGTTPGRMEGNTMGERVSSQHYLNRENSGDKRLQIMQSQYPNTPQNFQEDTKPFFKTKTNTNLQSQKDLPPNILVREPSRSQISSHLRMPVATSSGVDNNYDEQENLNDQESNYQQVYRPSTNFPESTKNLNKIRSDYLRRKTNNSGVIESNLDQNKPYPYTSNNDSRMLKNNYVQEDRNTNLQRSKEPSLHSIPKYDSTQRKREDSLLNLNKVNTTYLSHNKQQKSYPSYNDLWLQTSNPNKKLQIYDQFINRSRQLTKHIIEQLSFPASNRQFQPIDSNEKQNLYTFAVENMMIKLHFFYQQESMNGSEDNINVDAPVLYNHATYEQIKRQFYNYNLILGVTGNEGKIKVPLCCFVEYRGVLAVVKADIPPTYKEIEPYSYKEQFEALQNMVKVRFLFNTFNCYQNQSYRGTEGKFIVLWNLKNLIPGIPNNLKNQNSYFRKQLLLQYDEILQDLESSSEAHAFTLRHILPQFLAKLQSLQVQILHSKDLSRQFHRAGLSLSYLPEMYKQTDSIYLKRIFMSEIVAGIFTEVVRSELNHAFAILPTQNMHNTSSQELDSVIVACAHVLINEFFSYSLRSQSIWKLIVNQASNRYRIIVSKEDVIPGYILSGIAHKLSLQCDFKQKSLLKQKKFFIHENILPREVFLTFLPKVRRYDMESICPTYSKCKQLLESEELSVQNYEHLSMILNLKNRATQLPEYYGPILEQLKTYFANFIPYTLQQEFQRLDVYEFMYQQPVTHNGIKTAFLAIKWLIKANEIDKANQVFQIKFHELSYWLNEYNTAISGFYDFFSMFYASVGDFQESICLAKSSLINMTKILNPGALPVADKHYQLGNIYFKINKKNEALKQYNKTKQILINHQKTTIPEYGIILLKIALLCLNFGELTECLGNAIQAERIFQNNGGSQNQQIQCFQILARVYQITRKPSDMNNLCQACSKTLNMTENPKIMERMLKIITFPKISELSSQQQKHLLPILSKLQQNKSPSFPTLYLQSFNFLHKLSLKNYSIKKKLYNFLENVSILSEEINRKDLIRKHSSFNDKAMGEAEQMLVLIQAVGNIIGWNFLIGALKEGWYD